MPNGAILEREAGQVRGILPPLGRPDPPLAVVVLLVLGGVGRGGPAAHTVDGDLAFEFRDRVVQVRDLIPLGGAGGFVAGEFQMSAGDDQGPLGVGRGPGAGVGFVVAVPALADLPLPQPAGALCAGRSDDCPTRRSALPARYGC